MEAMIASWSEMGEGEEFSEEIRYHLDLHRDSDDESCDENEDDGKVMEERRLRRAYRARKGKFLRGELH